MQLTTTQYNLLERAIANRMRISVTRRGSEFLVVPRQLTTAEGREVLKMQQPSTGDEMTLFLDDIDGFEVVGD